MQFKLPELGEGVHEGELVRWRVKPGDAVKYDQPLCEVMTDKATVEIPSAFQGKVAELHVKEGQTVKVGQLMLSFEGAGKEAAAEAAPKVTEATPSPAAAAQAPSGAWVGNPTPVDAGAPHTRVLAAPSTRRLAREQGVELSAIPGSGPHGRVMREDVERVARSQGVAPAAMPSAGAPVGWKHPAAVPGADRGKLAPVAKLEERVPFMGLRKKISEKMRLSKDKAAHFTYVEEADATELVKLRAMAKDLGAKQGIKVTFLPFVMKAMVAALREYPILNSSLDEEKGELVYKRYFNIGLSIQTDDGLTAPVVKDVANKSVLQLARDIQELVDRARAKRLTREDFEGGTITLTNAGSIGGLFATPVINYPEVAILGFNKIFRKPVVVNVGEREEVAIRDWTYFSISLDHRVVDGAVGAEFMKLFIRYIENPSLMLV